MSEKASPRDIMFINHQHTPHVVRGRIVLVEALMETMGKRSAKGVFIRHDLSLFCLVSGFV
jgi:hypothetical protein